MFSFHKHLKRRSVARTFGAAIVMAAIVATTPDTASCSQPKSTSAKKVPPRPKLKLPFQLEVKYHPSGWMGDGEQGRKYLSLDKMSEPIGGQAKIVSRITYHRGPNGWAGVYWQYPDNNWCAKPGLNLTGAHKITFMARGNSGGEIVEFKAGSDKDTFEFSLGQQLLTKTWKAYTIDLTGQDLSNVCGAFAWSAPAPVGDELVFYLADLLVQ